MFILSKLEADVRVTPSDLQKPPLTAVTEVLERDYLDRVIPDLGLAGACWCCGSHPYISAAVQLALRQNAHCLLDYSIFTACLNGGRHHRQKSSGCALTPSAPNTQPTVSIYDVLSVAGGTIYPNDGAAYFKVAFRLVVFRPFAGEILIGKILSSSK